MPLLRRPWLVNLMLVLPALWPVWPLFLRPDPTALADPGKYLLHHQGFTAAVLLAIVLTFTPLLRLWPRAAFPRALHRHRRRVGVAAFLHAALHVTLHFIYEGGFGTFATDWQKPFVALGVAAFLILLALAATSFDGAIRRLGSRRWKTLHRLVYLAALLVAWHQILARKVFPLQVLWIFGPLVALQVARGWLHWRRNINPSCADRWRSH